MTRPDPDRPDSAPEPKTAASVDRPRLVRKVRRYREDQRADDHRADDQRADDQRGRPAADRDEVWGEGDTSNDARLRREVPPHHGG